MRNWLPVCPRPPGWCVDWRAILDTFPVLDQLAGCAQDPLHHGEGDVLVHTRLACEALANLDAFRALPPEERAIVFSAVLLHDVGKPGTTRLDLNGRITSPGHARRGAIEARVTLWGIGVPFSVREQVCSLVRHHQVPFHLIDRPDARRKAIEVSQSSRCDLLAIVAEADARGRVCRDLDHIREQVALFVEYCREQGCLNRPYPFASDHARFVYFQRDDRDPEYAAYDDTRCEAILLSGLPGAGKDTWLAEHLADLPVVSLDAIREDLGIGPEEPQGKVGAHARELARGYLRRGQPFVWNATNVSRDMRERLIRLFADYNARVRIVYVEVPEADLFAQNRARPKPVPADAIVRLLSRWEVPDLTEAHHVDWVVRSRADEQTCTLSRLH
jgi:predicted kinase